jgi:hypothetical protein
MSTYDPNAPYSDDDLLTRGQARAEGAQLLAEQTTRQKLEQAYYDQQPGHRHVPAEVNAAFAAYVAAHPETHQDLYREAVVGQVGEALSAAFFATRDAVDQRLGAARARRESSPSFDGRPREPSEDDRLAAIEEERARFEHRRRG